MIAFWFIIIATALLIPAMVLDAWSQGRGQSKRQDDGWHIGLVAIPGSERSSN